MKSTTTKTKAPSHKKLLVLLDAHAIIHRAYHALPDLRTKGGEPTGGLYGIASMLMKIIAELKPDHIIACYDLPEPTFRKKIYDAYKAGRMKADDDLVAQIERSQNIFRAFGIPILAHAGFEADDILGTIVEAMKRREDISIIIASGDMDTLQLVEGERVRVYTLRMGLSDTVMYDEDAVKKRFGFTPLLIADFKGLRGDPSDNIIGVPGIGEKTASELIHACGSIEGIYATLKKKPEAFKKAGIKPRIVELLKDNEEEALFSKTLATIRRDAPITVTLPDTLWREGVEESAITALFDELEFESLKRRALALLGNASVEKRKEENPDAGESTRARIALWLIDSNKTKAGPAEIYAHTKKENMPSALETLTHELKEKKLFSVYETIELPLIPLIARAEKRGVLVDIPLLKSLSVEYHKKLETIERRIYKETRGEFNINSPKQVAEALFGRLKLSSKGIGKTGGGALSTRESELLKLKGEHPVIDDILSHRELQKLLGTYIDAIPLLVDEEGRLHTHLNQTGTTTGRMSSERPNLQNIPAREGYGEAIREAFIAAPGHTWVSCDYSQIEMRVLAVMAEDEELIKIFREGKDVHSSVASRVFGVPESEVNKDMRRKAKVINFGIIYGMGVQTLKKNLGTDLTEAKEFYNQYFASFPNIGLFFEGVKAFARTHGYTQTLFGRRRYFHDINSKLPYLRASAERMAMNAPLQGTAADLMKIALRKAEEGLTNAGLSGKAHLLLAVHDELVYEVENGVRDEASAIIKGAMEGTAKLAVPLAANVSMGRNWKEAGIA